MRALYYITVIIIAFTVFNCTKKKDELQVKQDLCKRFKIDAPTYFRQKDPCDSGTTASFKVQFHFKGSEECLHLIETRPKFYDLKNNEISNPTYKSTFEKSEFTVKTGLDSVSFIFTIDFAIQADADNFNHLVLNFNTQNELEDESNKLEIRANTSCSVVDPSTYDVNPNPVNISSGGTGTFPIKLWDNAAEDGDIVSVHLNGRWVIENHTLTNAGDIFYIDKALLFPGPNDLVVFALNEGTSGPNTVSIEVNGKEIEGFKPGLLTGEAVRINF